MRAYGGDWGAALGPGSRLPCKRLVRTEDGKTHMMSAAFSAGCADYCWLDLTGVSATCARFNAVTDLNQECFIMLPLASDVNNINQTNSKPNRRIRRNRNCHHLQQTTSASRLFQWRVQNLSRNWGRDFQPSNPSLQTHDYATLCNVLMTFFSRVLGSRSFGQGLICLQHAPYGRCACPPESPWALWRPVMAERAD